MDRLYRADGARARRPRGVQTPAAGIAGTCGAVLLEGCAAGGGGFAVDVGA